MKALPDDGPNMPVIIERRVVLPAPFGPNNPKIDLSYTIRWSRSTASLPELYVFDNFLTTKGYKVKSYISDINYFYC